jgi:hypothetical protein
MRWKIIVLVIILACFLFVTAPGMAKDQGKDNGGKDADKGKSDKDTQSNGQSFDEIWKAIENLQLQIKNISLTPGPQGPSGPQGVVGPKGDTGTCECPVSLEEFNTLKARVAALEGNTNPAACTVGNVCTTGKPGICSAGTITQCLNNLGICTQFQQPVPEVCNNADDDCDGMVDNSATCPGGGQCVNGVCQFPMCGDGVCSGGENKVLCALDCGYPSSCAEYLALNPNLATGRYTIAGGAVVCCDMTTGGGVENPALCP